MASILKNSIHLEISNGYHTFLSNWVSFKNSDNLEKSRTAILENNPSLKIMGYIGQGEYSVTVTHYSNSRLARHSQQNMLIPPVTYLSASDIIRHKRQDFNSNQRSHQPKKLLVGSTFIPEENGCIIGHNNLVLDDVISLEDCKTHCEIQTEFGCFSLEYHSRSRRCVLSETDSFFDDVMYPCPNEGWLFTEIGVGSTFSPEENACIIGHNNLVLDNIISLDDCKAQCEMQTGFACVSLEYHSRSKRCVLSETGSYSSDFMDPCPNEGWLFTEIGGLVSSVLGTPLQ
ncbi:unnamed protein product, partial [Meganyctiphanes norvegica]